MLKSLFAVSLSCSLFALCNFGNPAHAAAKVSKESNLAMLECAELYETLTESAQKLDAQHYNSLQQELTSLAPVCQFALSTKQRNRLALETRETGTAWTAQDRDGLALHAVEMYRIMVERADHGSVPREVALMDYAGFRMTVLSKQAEINWNAVTITEKEANGWWLAIKPQLRNRNLRDAVNHTLSGWRRAVRDKNGGLLNYASTLDLILVDALEVHFSGKAAL